MLCIKAKLISSSAASLVSSRMIEPSAVIEPFDGTQGRLLERLEPAAAVRSVELLERLEPNPLNALARGIVYLPISLRFERSEAVERFERFELGSISVRPMFSN
jgi:hypothetical protein